MSREKFEKLWDCKCPKLTKLEYEDYCAKKTFGSEMHEQWYSDVIAVHRSKYGRHAN